MERVKINLPKKFLFETKVPVRISDVNYGGHLGNDSVLSFAHEARIRFLKHFGFSEKEVDGTSIIMFDAAVQYKSQGYYGDELIIYVSVENFFRNGCDFIFKITNEVNNNEIARVKTGIVFFDYKENKIVTVPEKFKELILKLNL